MNKTIEELAVELTINSDLSGLSKEEIAETFKYFHQAIKESYIGSIEEIKKANSVRPRPRSV